MLHTPITAAWNEAPEARAILRSLTPADVHIAVRTPIVGDRYHEWVAPYHEDALYDLRRAHIARLFGKSFADCRTDDERRGYLEFDARHETIAEVLRGIFGAPWDRPTDRVIDCDKGVGANQRWRAQSTLSRMERIG
jgi:hypothetical protein